MLADQENAAKVRDVLRRLLEQWHSSVTELREGETCYLPYDFSDQCTAWLRVDAVGPDLKVQRGWADVEGWSFFPSEVGALMKNLIGFRPDGQEVVMPREMFLRAIRIQATTA